MKYIVINKILKRYCEMGKNRCEVCKILNFQAQFYTENRETLHVFILLGSPKASLLLKQEV